MLAEFKEKLKYFAPGLIIRSEQDITVDRITKAARIICPFKQYKDRPLLELITESARSRDYIYWVLSTITEACKPEPFREFRFTFDHGWDFMAKFDWYKDEIVFLDGVLRSRLPKQKSVFATEGKIIQKSWGFFGTHEHWYVSLQNRIRAEIAKYTEFFKNWAPLSFYRNLYAEMFKYRRTLSSIEDRVTTPEDYAREMTLRDEEFLEKSILELNVQFEDFKLRYLREKSKQTAEQITLFG